MNIVKKIFILIIFMLFIFVEFIYHTDDPYTGKYDTNGNITLELKRNGKCTLEANSYKNVFYTEGRYSIKDNNITIDIPKSECSYFGGTSIKGKFQGNRLEIYDFIQKRNYDYYRE